MSTSQPLVSVLIPTFNRSGMLTQAVESAVRQTYRSLEIVVADNASSDDTAAVVERLAGVDGRIRYVRHASNLGYLGNIQSLLDEARGEYVKFLMDDDVLLPECVSTLVGPCVADPSIGFATSKRTYVDPSLRPLPDVASTQAIRTEDGVLDGHELGNLVLRTNLNVLGEGSTVLFRRSLLGGADALTFGDSDFEAILDVSLWLKILSQCRAFYSARPLSLFRAHGGQGGADYLAPFLGTIEWGRIILASKQFGFLADQSLELEALGTFLRTASQIRLRVTDAGHLVMLDEAVARAGDRLVAFAAGRGGPEERSADGRASRALREIDRAAALAGDFPAPLPPVAVAVPVAAPEPVGAPSFDYDVSLVVVTRNPGDALLAGLNTVEEHTAGCSYEVVIVDRSSDDGTEMLLSCLEGDVQVVSLPAETSWSSASMAGADAARGRDVVLLPADAVVTAGWLKELRNVGASAGGRWGAVAAGDIVLVNRDALADAMGLDNLDAAGTPLTRLFGRMTRRGWSVGECSGGRGGRTDVC